MISIVCPWTTLHTCRFHWHFHKVKIAGSTITTVRSATVSHSFIRYRGDKAINRKTAAIMPSNISDDQTNRGVGHFEAEFGGREGYDTIRYDRRV